MNSLDWPFPLGDINNTGYPAYIAHAGTMGTTRTSGSSAVADM